MKKIGIVGVALVGLMLSGCSVGSTPEPAAESPSASPSPASAPTAKPSTGLSQECTEGARENASSEPLNAVVVAAPVPEGVTVLDAESVASTSEEGVTDVTVRICSSPISAALHRESATAIARAVYESGLGASIGRFAVSSWAPEGKSLRLSRELRVDYFTFYLWDSETVDMDTNWKTASE